MTSYLDRDARRDTGAVPARSCLWPSIQNLTRHQRAARLHFRSNSAEMRRDILLRMGRILRPIAETLSSLRANPRQ